MSRAHLFLLGVLAAPLPVRAVAPVTVVVHGMDPAAVESTWLQQNGPAEAPRFVAVDEVFDPGSAVVLLGDPAVVGCVGERRPASDLAAMNEHVIESLTDMEYLAAATVVENTTRLLPCLTEPPVAEVLGQHHFLRGIVAFEAEGEQAAVDRFEEALLVSPFLQWNELYPPTVRPAFEAAVTSAIHAKKAFVSVSERILEEGALWIDGLPVDRRTRTTTLYAGTHLVQWRGEGQDLRSWSVDAEPGQSLTLVHRADAIDEVLTGRAGPEVTRYVRERVLAPVEQGPEGSLVVAQEADIVLFHRYDVAAARWTLADVRDLLDYRTRGRQLRNTGVALTAGGLVLGVVGAVVGGLAALETELIRYSIEEADDRQAEFLASAPDYARAQQIQRAGISFLVVGGAASLSGIPMQIVGNKRKQAHGVGKRRRR